MHPGAPGTPKKRIVLFLSLLALRAGMASGPIGGRGAAAQPIGTHGFSAAALSSADPASLPVAAASDTAPAASPTSPIDALVPPERRALRPILMQAATQYGLPADVIQAQAWAESSWRVTAISGQGAAGVLQLTPDTVDLRRLAEEVATHLGVLAEEKRQSMSVEAEGSPQGLSDRLMLRQSLINLVDNAIKYTPAGGRIVIRVAESATAAAIDVIDNGPGIVDELRGRIFDRYYRAGETRSAEAGGTGLGLSITKWSVEVNGGQLSVEPTSGGGSTFRITLPRTRSSRAQEGRRRTA